MVGCSLQNSGASPDHQLAGNAWSRQSGSKGMHDSLMVEQVEDVELTLAKDEVESRADEKGMLACAELLIPLVLWFSFGVVG